jgi:lysyl-tRNA synthetase class 2
MSGQKESACRLWQLHSASLTPLLFQSYLLIVLYRDSENAELFEGLHDTFRRGDIVGVTGTPVRTKKGELSIAPKKMVLLSPNLHQLPRQEQVIVGKDGAQETKFGFKDQEARYRSRYLDLIMNQHVREIFVKRSRIITYIRSYFLEHNFLEVGHSSSYMLQQ